MKALSKPISSPGRAENFPPPLMRFLRSNTGSRSRGRSRSSPMFYVRSKRNAMETNQEPSSPKVTCIGQVRAAKSGRGGASKNRRLFWLLKKPFSCGNFSVRFHQQRRALRRVFCKWGLFLRFGCKRVDAKEDSFRAEKVVSGHDMNGSSSGSETEFYNRKCEESNLSLTPPRNALILARCRSAPYRSSSLGGIFWSSPFGENDAKRNDLEKPRCENAVEEAGTGQESGRELESVEGLKGIGGGGAVHPLLLTRCKSEPARIGERVNPDANFLKQNSPT